MKYIYFLITIFSISLLASVINAKEGFTCFLEIIPAIIGFLILALTFKKFRFTNFTYTLILIHCIILFIGGHYTYAEVPFFDYIKEVFHQEDLLTVEILKEPKQVTFKNLQRHTKISFLR